MTKGRRRGDKGAIKQWHDNDVQGPTSPQTFQRHATSSWRRATSPATLRAYDAALSIAAVILGTFLSLRRLRLGKARYDTWTLTLYDRPHHKHA